MFLRRWHRHRLARRKIPPEWLPIVEEHFPWLAELESAEREGFWAHLKAFVWGVHWVGANGQEITDEVKVVIAGCAARIARRLPPEVYDRLTEVVVYPASYVDPRHGSGPVRLGEAHHWGVVVVSWDAVKRGIALGNDARNTAIHEFAHVLDVEDGTFDGTPQLEAGRDYSEWARVMGKHFERLRERPARHFLDAYGATNEAEFFAVATETFFEKPRVLRRKAPDLYQQLANYFRVDPAQ